MKTYRFVSPAIIILLVGLLISCNGGKKANQEVKEAEILPPDIVELRTDQIKLANIETGTIEIRSLSGVLKVNGTVAVAPQNFATVCMPMGGFIKSTPLMPGNAVTKGQTLAILENQEFVDIQQNYLEAKSRLEFTEADYKRHAELYKEDVYSQKNLQQVTADYKSLKALVHAFEQKLALIGIDPANLHEDDICRSVAVVSPITGYIKAVNINIGKYVAPTDVMYEIINSDKLYVELTRSERVSYNVSSFQKILFVAFDHFSVN